MMTQLLVLGGCVCVCVCMYEGVVIHWVSAEADPKSKSRVPAAYLGSDPRKHWKRSKEVSKGRKRGVSEQVITVGSWSSRLLGKLGSVEPV